MTGAAVVRWESGGATVLAVHGAFDGASAWTLRHEMDEGAGPEFVVDLTHAVEACDFAAAILAAWSRQRPDRHLSFRPGAPDHARILRAHGLEVLSDEADLAPALAFPPPRSLPVSGAVA